VVTPLLFSTSLSAIGVKNFGCLEKQLICLVIMRGYKYVNLYFFRFDGLIKVFYLDR